MTLPALSKISGNSEQKAILQTIEQLIQYTLLEIQFWSLKYTAVIRIHKNLSNLPFLSKWYKPYTSNCKYLLKLYYKSIIILLANVLANICSEISKIWLILWMVYTCNVKGLEEVEKLGRNECTLHRWPRSPVMSDCSRPYQ